MEADVKYFWRGKMIKMNNVELYEEYTLGDGSFIFFKKKNDPKLWIRVYRPSPWVDIEMPVFNDVVDFSTANNNIDYTVEIYIERVEQNKVSLIIKQS